jgi:hypothetical protein
MRVTLIRFRRHGVRPHRGPLDEPTDDAMQAAAATFRAIAPFDLTVI